MKLDIDLNQLTMEELKLVLRLAEGKKEIFYEPQPTVRKEDERTTFYHRKKKLGEFEASVQRARIYLEQNKENITSTDLYKRLWGVNSRKYNPEVRMRFAQEVSKILPEGFIANKGKGGKHITFDFGKKRERLWNSKYHQFFGTRIKHYISIGLPFEQASREANNDWRHSHSLEKPEPLKPLFFSFLKNELATKKEVSASDYEFFMQSQGRKTPVWNDFISLVLTNIEQIEKSLGFGSLLVQNQKIIIRPNPSSTIVGRQ